MTKSLEILAKGRTAVWKRRKDDIIVLEQNSKIVKTIPIECDEEDD